jgi:tRNA (mo5U34)-methyltransferase
VDTETLKRRIAEIGFWYHRIPLPGGITTPGITPYDPSPYRIPADLTGKRILDVGAWDGYWTFEALRRGAREAVAIDDFSDHLGRLKPEDRHAWKTFDLCREALGYGEDRCTRREISIYDLTEQAPGGRFDVAFFFGVLYHLRHPLLGLDRLSAVCNPGAQIFVESQICDDFSAYRGLGHGYPDQQRVCEFYPTDELAGNSTNWWSPTLECLCGLLYAAGFTEGVSGWKLAERPTDPSQCRGFATARKPGAQAR